MSRITSRPLAIALSLAFATLPLLSSANAQQASAKLPTPPEVWKDYDPNAGDFKEEIVREETKDGIYQKDTYISAYVNGEEVRVYCKYGVKAGAQKAPGLMNIHGWMSVAGLDPAFINDGWAVMAHDYCGKSGTRPHYTKYPESLRHGNMDAAVGTRIKAKLPDGKDITDPKQTDDYLWYAIQRRVLSYLLAQKEVDPSRIGAKGYSYGGTIIWNLGMDPRVKAIVAYFGNGWTDYYRDRAVWMHNNPYVEPPKSPGDELLLSSIVPQAHSPYIKAATLLLNGTNDHHGGHERGEQNFKQFQPGVPFSFAHQARGLHDTNKLGNGAKLWLEKYVLGKDIFWPARPSSGIKLDAAGVPEFRIKPASPEKIESLEIYFAHKEPNNCARLWLDAKAEKIGNAWVAKVPVKNIDDYVFAFANIRYTGDIVISSDFAAAIPSKLGKAVATRVDPEDGSESWSHVLPVEGVGGVKALRPTSNPLGTNCSQFDEPQRKAPEGAVMVLRVHSPQAQTIALVANNQFSTELPITASEEWQSIEVPAEQMRFRGNGDPLKNWSQAKTVSIRPKTGSDITKLLFCDPKWKAAASTTLPKP